MGFYLNKDFFSSFCSVCSHLTNNSDNNNNKSNNMNSMYMYRSVTSLLLIMVMTSFNSIEAKAKVATLKYQVGSEVVLKCGDYDPDNANGINGQWFKGVKLIKLFSPSEPTTLTLPSADINDTASYECLKSEVGAIRKKVILQVFPIPVLRVEAYDVTIDEQVQTVAACFATNVSGGYTLKWLNESQPEVTETKNGFKGVDLEMNIQLPVTSSNRERVVTCELVVDMFDDVINKSVELRIQEPTTPAPTPPPTEAPQILEFPEEDEIIVIVGSDNSFECSGSGVPEPRVVWYKKSDPMSSRDFSSASAVLKINSAVYADSGKWTCKMTNEAGTVERDFVLNVHGKPKIHSKNSTKILQRQIEHEGGEVTLVCKVTSFPAADIEWVRGSSNSSNNSVSEDEAEVEVVADEAFGKFVKTSKIKISSEAFKSGENQIVCKATTTYGSDELKFVITKDSPPMASTSLNSGLVALTVIIAVLVVVLVVSALLHLKRRNSSDGDDAEAAGGCNAAMLCGSNAKKTLEEAAEEDQEKETPSSADDVIVKEADDDAATSSEKLMKPKENSNSQDDVTADNDVAIQEEEEKEEMLKKDDDVITTSGGQKMKIIPSLTSCCRKSRKKLQQEEDEEEGNDDVIDDAADAAAAPSGDAADDVTAGGEAEKVGAGEEVVDDVIKTATKQAAGGTDDVTADDVDSFDRDSGKGDTLRQNTEPPSGQINEDDH